MSEYLIPVTFEGQHIAPSDDGATWSACLTDGIGSGCALTRAGSTLTVGTGKLVAAGRTARVDTAKSFALGSSGYDRLVLTIDLTKTSVAQQVALDIQHSATLSGFSPALVQDDINGSGTKYQFVICIIDDSGSGILWNCGLTHSKGYGTSVQIATGDWSNNQAVKYVDGVLQDSKVIVTPDPASQAACDANGVIAYSQSDCTITFKCTTVPSGSVTFNILLY